MLLLQFLQLSYLIWYAGYLTIIPRALVGYEVVDFKPGRISNKRGWNNFVNYNNKKKTPKKMS